MSDENLVIPPPRRDRPPMHGNAFDVAQGSNTQLKPLFPYLHPGAMVPASALLIGGPDADYGHFFHHNTQHEIVLTLAANGAVLPTGQVFIGAVIHGVNSFLKNEKDAKSFATFVITQMQAESGVQTEACSLRCEKCHEQIFFKEFDATPTQRQPKRISRSFRWQPCQGFSRNTTTTRRITSAPNAATSTVNFRSPPGVGTNTPIRARRR